MTIKLGVELRTDVMQEFADRLNSGDVVQAGIVIWPAPVADVNAWPGVGWLINYTFPLPVSVVVNGDTVTIVVSFVEMLVLSPGTPAFFRFLVMDINIGTYTALQGTVGETGDPNAELTFDDATDWQTDGAVVIGDMTLTMGP